MRLRLGQATSLPLSSVRFAQSGDNGGGTFAVGTMREMKKVRPRASVQRDACRLSSRQFHSHVARGRASR